jgi:hypothetical protein
LYIRHVELDFALELAIAGLIEVPDYDPFIIDLRSELTLLEYGELDISFHAHAEVPIISGPIQDHLP